MNASRLNLDVPPLDSSSRPSSLTPPFPKLWIGFTLAIGVLACELSAGLISALGFAAAGATFYVAAIAVYLGGLIYWYFWLYRIHKILANATFSIYPITPQKAVGYRFIPFYNLFYWNIRWTNQIADFVNGAEAVAMPRGWVGVWLIVAALVFVFDRGLELLVLFTISVYLTNKIKKSLAPSLATFAAAPPVTALFDLNDAFSSHPQAVSFASARAPAVPPVAGAWNFDLAKQWGIPVSAGVGAAFGFLMCYGFWLSTMGTEATIGTFALNVLVVAVMLYFFLEPLVDKLLEAFGVADHHESRKVWHRLFRFFVFVVIVDVAHSLLERATEQSGGAEVAEFGILFTVFFGGMTFLWIISGARTKPLEALAVVTVGTILLVSFGYRVVHTADSIYNDIHNKASNDQAPENKNYLANLNLDVDQVKDASLDQLNQSSTRKVGAEIVNLDRSKKIAGGIGLLWALCVALAGFIAMRRTFKPLIVATTVFGISAVVGVIFAVVATGE